MKPEVIVKLERTRVEVGTATPRRPRPGYRWASAYHVIRPDGTKEYPPLRRAEAYARARELGATKIEVVS